MGAAWLAAALVAYNAAANRWKPFHSWAYLPANLTLAAAVVWLGAAAFDLSAGEMGFRGGSIRVGAAIGVALGVAAMVPVYAALGFERGRALLRDRRLSGVRGAKAAFVLLVRIPIGTALVEETVFRGVLLGSAMSHGTAQAVALSSVAFGLWHIVPTWILARKNRLNVAVVPAGVVVTGAAGAFLAWLRIETGGIAAPVALHVLVNSPAAAAAMIALRLPAASRGPSR
ncbi:MAG TPA: CPBP family intramembrane glutamic endopeptidase [Actinomycetota bacterium]|nr:CPBP family intramembrane glutamic endopeptidase [Actinomycetota bacterium]